MAKLNPLDLNGPAKTPWVEQPDYRVPVVDPKVAAYPTGANPLALSQPLPKYNQPNILPPPVKTGGLLL